MHPGTDALRIYEDLVHQPRSRDAEIAKRTGYSVPVVLGALEELRTRRMAVQLQRDGEEAWEAQPPDSADVLAVEEQRLAALREQMTRLTDVYWFARRESKAYPAVEVLHDRTAVFEQSLRIVADARHDVRWFDCPPYHLDYSGPDSPMGKQLAVQRERIAGGVRCRTIYRSDVFDLPEHADRALRSVIDGEQARGLPNVPMKMVIGDEKQAMIPLDAPELVGGATLVVQASGLLDALVSIFETLWVLAVPISPGASTTGVLDDIDREILMMMAAGLTDDTVARQLNVSRRTVVRRAAGLLERLGATTRFQAGIQAARLGWL